VTAHASAKTHRPIESPLARRLARLVSSDVVDPQLVTPDLMPLAGRWRMLPLLAFRIQHGAPDAELLEELSPELSAAVVEEMVATAETREVVSSLAAAGVDHLLMKGAALSHTHYPQPHLRLRGDTDILIRSVDRGVVDATLTALGYARPPALTGHAVSHQQQYVRRLPSGAAHAVDLHWKAFNPAVFAGLFAFDDLWTSSVPVPALGPAARTPDAAATLLMLTIHRVAHHEPAAELLPLYDVHLVASRLSDDEWMRLERLAAARDVAPLCARALGESCELFGTPLPSAAADWVTTQASVPVPARFAPFLREHRRLADVVLSDFGAASWRARFQLIREHLLPPAGYLRARHGRIAGWRLPYFYARRIVTGVPRWFRRDLYR
jgi:hypothetical protein